MMKNAFLTLLGTAVLIHAQNTQSDHYSAQWSGFDVKEIIANARVFGKYKECLITDKLSGCPQETQELKKFLIDALESTCDKCSTRQLTKVRESLGYICKMRKPDFVEILQHFDPSGTNRARFESKFGKFDC